MSYTSVIQHAENNQWLRFSDPRQVITAYLPENIGPALDMIEKGVTDQGLYAVGFISYEAAPGFDSALCSHPPDMFPLIWFGLYPEPEKIELGPLPEKVLHAPAHWTPSVEEKAYHQAIAQIKAHIARGETYQVNYTLRLHARFSGDPWKFFLELMRVQKTRYAAYIDTGRFVVCSASPELFFSLKDRELTLRPMKGTAARGVTQSEDLYQGQWLCHSIKNRAENVMIVDMIRNDAGRIAAPGSVHVPRLFEIEKYPTVWQMTSTVGARTEARFPEIMRALFPCASITGAPKPSTMKIIKDLETGPRHVYTGCIGFLAPGPEARFSIAIRTVMIDRETGQAEYGVGGGIVWDSDTRDEYNECRIKAYVLTEKRPDFSLLETILWTSDTDYFLLDYHLRRLKDSAAYFDFPIDTERIGKELAKLRNDFDNTCSYKVRLLISETGLIGCEAVPLDMTASSEPVRVRLAKNPVISDNLFLYHKTTHRQVYETARQNTPENDDVILHNERGEITETTIANIVVKHNEKLITPPVRCGLLGGTFRAWLLDQGEIAEDIVTPLMLRNCERIYLINSVRKWRNAVLIE